jgi:hypothetical protein
MFLNICLNFHFQPLAEGVNLGANMGDYFQRGLIRV